MTQSFKETQDFDPLVSRANPRRQKHSDLRLLTPTAAREQAKETLCAAGAMQVGSQGTTDGLDSLGPHLRPTTSAAVRHRKATEMRCLGILLRRGRERLTLSTSWEELANLPRISASEAGGEGDAVRLLLSAHKQLSLHKTLTH